MCETVFLYANKYDEISALYSKDFSICDKRHTNKVKVEFKGRKGEVKFVLPKGHGHCFLWKNHSVTNADSSKQNLASEYSTDVCLRFDYYSWNPAMSSSTMQRLGEGPRQSKHVVISPQASPCCVFELCSAGTSVVLVLLVNASWAQLSSSFSPVDSSSEDSLKNRKRKINMSVPRSEPIPKVTVICSILRGKPGGETWCCAESCVYYDLRSRLQVL